MLPVISNLPVQTLFPFTGILSKAIRFDTRRRLRKIVKPNRREENALPRREGTEFRGIIKPDFNMVEGLMQPCWHTGVVAGVFDRADKGF
jgi:hypothetical protein